MCEIFIQFLRTWARINPKAFEQAKARREGKRVSRQNLIMRLVCLLCPMLLPCCEAFFVCRPKPSPKKMQGKTDLLSLALPSSHPVATLSALSDLLSPLSNSLVLSLRIDFRPFVRKLLSLDVMRRNLSDSIPLIENLQFYKICSYKSCNISNLGDENTFSSWMFMTPVAR